MAGEIILSEVATPSTPSSGKEGLYVSSETLPRLRRLDSAGSIWPIEEILMMALSADYTLTDSNAAQKAFNASTAGAITLPGSSAYLMEFLYLITNIGTVSHTWGVLFGGTATLTSGALAVSGRSGATSAATLAADSSAFTTDLTSVLVATAASTSATEQVILRGKGVVRINAGGTFIPQVKMSTAAGSTEKMLANSFIKLTPIGANTATNLGNWS